MPPRGRTADLTPREKLGSSFFDVQLPKRRPAHDRFVQKIALTAVVDQAV